MTGSASGVARTFMDYDSYKNQEWLRRRKLRLEQVRKQSNEIAKALRQKVIDGEKARLEEYERMSEANIIDWKAEKLAELEWKLRSALEEFGESHRQAEEEEELGLEEITQEKYKINFAKAQRRGEIAQQEELKRKKVAIEKKMSPIQRKQLARKKEDLRSALVCAVPLKKQFMDTEEICTEVYTKEVSTKKIKKKVISHKTCSCKSKGSLNNSLSKVPETEWINLNKIQSRETVNSELQPRVSKSSISTCKSQKESLEGTVEFYDFSSRYHSKTFRDYPHLVERIDSVSEVPNANELAEIEEKKEKEEAKKKMEVDALTQERGMEALKKIKIQRNYNNLITKLEELNKKEKILKSQQRNASRFFYMNDERLSERARNKQKMMDAKFESIYFEATAKIPQSEASYSFNLSQSQGGGDYAQFHDEQPYQLNFTPSHLKPNTPVISQDESPSSFSEEKTRPKKIKKKQQLLLDIDRALKEGRDLRKTASRKNDIECDEDTENHKSSSDSEASSPSKDETKMKSQESQTDNIKEVEKMDNREDFKSFDNTADESLPVSSATSYKSPPSVIRSYRLRQILDSMDEVIESNDQEKTKINKFFNDELQQQQSLNQLEKNQDTSEYPTLEYYIEKLLSMSRECIANLSVSSENVSTPNITDLDAKNEKVSICTVSSKTEDLVRKSTVERANQLEETIKNWKKILSKNAEKFLPDVENVSESRLMIDEKKQSEDSATVLGSPSIKTRYEEITKKCSERISELSDMLDKVRRDKERLLSSTSGGSSLSLNKDEKSEKESVGDEEEGMTNSSDQEKAFESFIHRFNLERPAEETALTAVLDFQSSESSEESLNSWPDVMDELLKKEILTSPFKWSDGDCSSEFTKISDKWTKPSSVETVIGKFRKEIKKIKPFSLPDSIPQCDSQRDSELRVSCDEDYKESLFDRKKTYLIPSQRSENGTYLQEESSVESINHALTSLGLNWAKSFLRKNEESRAMSSSSNSVEKLSEDEKDNFN